MEVTTKNHEIASLREHVDQANPPKRRKVAINPNERFASLAEVLSQANQEPSQRVRKVRNASQKVIIVEEESSSEEEAEQPLVRRSARERRRTQRYLDRDLSTDEESGYMLQMQFFFILLQIYLIKL